MEIHKKNYQYNDDEPAKNFDSRKNEIFFRIAASARSILAIVSFNRRWVSSFLIIPNVFTVKHML